MATDLTKLVNLGTLQAYINKTISLVKDNFAKRNQAIKRVELVLEIVPPETEEKPYIKLYYIDDKDIDSTTGLPVDHIEYIPITIDLGGSINEWVASKSYKVDDIVIYDNKIYKCIILNNDAAFDDTKWQILGSDFKIEEYTSGTDYKVDDIITYKQHLYKCKVEPQADNTTFNKAEWTLLAINDREKELLDSLKVEELHDNLINPAEVTGFKILFKNLDTSANTVVDSELLQVKDLIPKFVDDNASLTDAKSSEKLLSAKKILELIATVTGGLDMSLYATKDLLYYTHTTYTRCLSTDDNAKKVVSTVSDPDTEVAYDDVVVEIPDIATDEFVLTGVGYDDYKLVEKDSDLYKSILSQFSYETILDPDDGVTIQIGRAHV